LLVDGGLLEGTLNNESQVSPTKNSNFNPGNQTPKSSAKKNKPSKKLESSSPYDAKLFVSMLIKESGNIGNIFGKTISKFV
jgi:hypothetical protein